MSVIYVDQPALSYVPTSGSMATLRIWPNYQGLERICAYCGSQKRQIKCQECGASVDERAPERPGQVRFEATDYEDDDPGFWARLLGIRPRTRKVVVR